MKVCVFYLQLFGLPGVQSERPHLGQVDSQAPGNRMMSHYEHISSSVSVHFEETTFDNTQRSVSFYKVVTSFYKVKELQKLWTEHEDVHRH